MDQQVDGIYVVLKRNQNLLLKNFYAVLRPEDKTIIAAQIDISNFPNEPQFDSEGAEVDLTPGALVYFTKLADHGKGLVFNIANVAPTDEVGVLQYHYVLQALGLQECTLPENWRITADPHFRNICANFIRKSGRVN